MRVLSNKKLSLISLLQSTYQSRLHWGDSWQSENTTCFYGTRPDAIQQFFRYSFLHMNHFQMLNAIIRISTFTEPTKSVDEQENINLGSSSSSNHTNKQIRKRRIPQAQISFRHFSNYVLLQVLPFVCSMGWLTQSILTLLDEWVFACGPEKYLLCYKMMEYFKVASISFDAYNLTFAFDPRPEYKSLSYDLYLRQCTYDIQTRDVYLDQGLYNHKIRYKVKDVSYCVQGKQSVIPAYLHHALDQFRYWAMNLRMEAAIWALVLIHAEEFTKQCNSYVNESSFEQRFARVVTLPFIRKNMLKGFPFNRLNRFGKQFDSNIERDDTMEHWIRREACRENIPCVLINGNTHLSTSELQTREDSFFIDEYSDLFIHANNTLFQMTNEEVLEYTNKQVSKRELELWMKEFQTDSLAEIIKLLPLSFFQDTGVNYINVTGCKTVNKDSLSYYIFNYCARVLSKKVYPKNNLLKQEFEAQYKIFLEADTHTRESKATKNATHKLSITDARRVKYTAVIKTVELLYMFKFTSICDVVKDRQKIHQQVETEINKLDGLTLSQFNLKLVLSHEDFKNVTPEQMYHTLIKSIGMNNTSLGMNNRYPINIKQMITQSVEEFQNRFSVRNPILYLKPICSMCGCKSSEEKPPLIEIFPLIYYCSPCIEKKNSEFNLMQFSGLGKALLLHKHLKRTTPLPTMNSIYSLKEQEREREQEDLCELEITLPSHSEITDVQLTTPVPSPSTLNQEEEEGSSIEMYGSEWAAQQNFLGQGEEYPIEFDSLAWTTQQTPPPPVVKSPPLFENMSNYEKCVFGTDLESDSVYMDDEEEGSQLGEFCIPFKRVRYVDNNPFIL